jgi:hypothetical protein
MEKGECRLCALVFIRPVRMQAIATATRRRVVHREVQVVSPEKPLECAVGFCVPAFFPSDTMCCKAGRNHRLRFYRLLVETSAFATLWIKPIGANWNEMLSFCVRVLQFCQPSERLQTDLRHDRIWDRLAAQEHGVGQRCIAIRQLIFKPVPSFYPVIFIK